MLCRIVLHVMGVGWRRGKRREEEDKGKRGKRREEGERKEREGTTGQRREGSNAKLFIHPPPPDRPPLAEITGMKNLPCNFVILSSTF